MRAVRTRRRSQQMLQGTFSCASAIHLVAGCLQDFQSFRSLLTPLTYIYVGDEVIAALMCTDANHELIEAPFILLKIHNNLSAFFPHVCLSRTISKPECPMRSRNF